MAELSHDWLEKELRGQLGAVKAPDSLWTRVQTERRERRNPQRPVWMLWPAVAMVLLAASADLVWQIGRSTGSGVRIESNNPAELRAWLKTKANIGLETSCRTCHLDGHGQI